MRRGAQCYLRMLYIIGATRIRVWLRCSRSWGLGGSLLCHWIPLEVCYSSSYVICNVLNIVTGLLVSVVILQQGFSLLAGAFGDLTDAGISPATRQKLTRELEPLIASQPSVPTSSVPLASTPSSLLGIRDLRGKRSGSLMFVDLTADVSGLLSVRETSELEAKITSTLKSARKEIAEVRVQFHPVEDDTESTR